MSYTDNFSLAFDVVVPGKKTLLTTCLLDLLKTLAGLFKILKYNPESLLAR